jgi:hypothetical protein
MQTHRDMDANFWLDSLKQKAAKMKAAKKSEIAGSDDVIEEWKSNGVGVRKLPDDEHGVLRISIGGGDTPVGVNYCVFRGDHSACVDLLRKALKALESPHD